MTGRPIRVLELRSVVGAGGGPEKTILLGAQRTDPTRFAVTVCYLRDARDTRFSVGQWAQSLGVDYVELRERTSFDPRLWTSLRQVVRERGIDIVHAHEYKTDLLTFMLARSERVIPLATAHGWTGHSGRERWLYYPADKRVLRGFALTIAVSGQIRADLVKAGLRAEQVRVVLNGIDHRAFQRDRSRQAVARRDLQLEADDIVIGAAGRLEPQKRFDLLIRACAELQAKHPKIRLRIAGEGSRRQELEELGRRLMPGGAFALLGHRPDVIALHHALDVYVQTSDYEGTPNAVLEAMALETPVVATAAGGTAEMIEHGVHGLIVPIGDTKAIVDAVEQALSNPAETAQRAARARRRVETVLSFATRMSTVENIYEELMRGHQRESHERL